MIDDILDNDQTKSADQEDDFPSFLRSSDPENQDHDFDHFLDDDLVDPLSISVETLHNTQRADDPAEIDFTTLPDVGGIDDEAWFNDDLGVNNANDGDIIAISEANIPELSEAKVEEGTDINLPQSSLKPAPEDLNPDDYLSFDVPEPTQRQFGSFEQASASEDPIINEGEAVEWSEENIVDSSPRLSENEITDWSDTAFQNTDATETVAFAEPEAAFAEVADFEDEATIDVDDDITEPKIDSRELHEKEQINMLKWYSGRRDDKYFEFSATDSSGEFIANQEINSIHINIGKSAYGWNVTFENGLNMNLADVREYQIRNGRLPSSSGSISYGSVLLQFYNVERIVIYRAPEYFHYGF